MGFMMQSKETCLQGEDKMLVMDNVIFDAQKARIAIVLGGFSRNALAIHCQYELPMLFQQNPLI